MDKLKEYQREFRKLVVEKDLQKRKEGLIKLGKELEKNYDLKNTDFSLNSEDRDVIRLYVAIRGTM
jgi:uncharacterized protein YajQ (UPF0234 family)